MTASRNAWECGCQKEESPSSSPKRFCTDGFATTIYSQDFDERIPSLTVDAPGDPRSDGKQMGWTNVIQPYIKNEGVLCCPSYAIIAPYNSGARSLPALGMSA
jgi:hypothetical protein